MSRAERDALLRASVAEDPGDPRSTRYAVRRAGGRLELFEAQFTEEIQGDFVFHGFPWYHPDYWRNPKPVPLRVLRQLRERGDITASEYSRALRGKLFE